MSVKTPLAYAPAEAGTRITPYTPLNIVVGTLNGNEYKTLSPNQVFNEMGHATIMINEKNKAELMYDELTFQSPPLNLNDSVAPMFNGNPPSEIKAKLYTKKFKLFGGNDKKVKQEMLAGRAGTRTEALVIKRNEYVSSQIMSKVTVTVPLLLLVREGEDFFLTSTKYKLSFDRKGSEDFALKGAATSVGSIVEIVYDSNNKSCAVISGLDLA